MENKTNVFIFIATGATRTAEQIGTIRVVSRDVALPRYIREGAAAHAADVGQALKVRV